MDKPTPTDVEHEVTSVDMIVSKSDEAGNITYTNPIFMKISGYSQGELLDQPHSILRHPDCSFRNYESTRRQVSDSAKEAVSALYAKLLEIEKSDGVEASEKALMDFLAENGQSPETFNDFMTELNKAA